MDKLKRVVAFMGMSLIIFGVVGSFGYLIYHEEYVFAIAELIVAVGVAPTVVKLYHTMIDL